MRLSRFAYSALLLFFASAFVAAALPSKALAATLDVTQGVEVMYVRDYDVRMDDVTLSQAREVMNKRMQHVEISNGTMTYTEDNDGYSTGSNYSGAVRTTANGYPYVNSFVRDTAYDYIYIDTSGTGKVTNQATSAWVATGMPSVDAYEANPAMGVEIVWAKQVMPANSGFYVFLPYVNMVMRVGNNTLNCVMNGMRVFAGPSMSELVECTYDGTTGTWTCSKSVKVLLMVFNASNRTVSNLYQSHDYYIYGKPSVYAMLSDVNIVNLQNNIETNVEDQTQQLMDTSGSDDVVDDALEGGTQIATDMNFVQQSGAFVTGVFGAVSGSTATSSLAFPGLTFQGYTIIAAQSIPFTGYLGTEFENRIKDFCTLVLFLAWMMGLRSLYHRMFLGEKEVEVMDE